jgi:tetratricopeptide (TPR) repeat protein
MRQLYIAATILLGCYGTLAAQGERLGTITFATSGTPAAQQHFLRGVLYLHSFEYESAAQEFQSAQRREPGFAMAYWGEAMTYNHPVWDQQDKPAALAVLNRLAATPEGRARRAATPRERAWLHAVEVLYGPGTKPERDTLYSSEMERIAASAPGDDEAQTFYALSLMGLSQGIRVIPTYLRAGAIALGVLQRNPDHPGAAHYAIHAFDDPTHAPMGLHAAEVYSGIAPGAAHAQHMTTHIFLALGRWDEVVKQNIVASGTDTTKWMPGHYTSWLEYGLLQQGRFDDASHLLDLMARNLSDTEPLSRRGILVLMHDYYLVNTEQWNYAPPLVNTDGAGPMLQAVHAFSLGYAALKRNQLDRARNHLQTLLMLTDSAGSPAQVGVLAYELAGLVHVGAGDTTQGLGLLRQAAGIEDTIPMEFGPPLIVKPTHEALGETYLALGRPAEAQREFARALELAPRRMRALLGLARAATDAGNHEIAEHAWDELSDVSRRGDPTLWQGIPKLLRRHISSRTSDARAAVEEAIARDRHNPNLYDLLSNVCVFENNFKCAVDALESLYTIDSTKADSTFFTKITVFAAQPPEAPDTARLIKWARAGVNKYPTNVTLMNQLLGGYAMKGEMDSAVSLATRLVDLDTTTAAPVVLVMKQLLEQEDVTKALPLVPLIARRGSAKDKEDAASQLVNSAFGILRQPGGSGIEDTVRLGLAAEVSRQAVALADSMGQVWPNANYALGMSTVFVISRLAPEVERQKSCGLARREDALIREAALAISRAHPNQGPEHLDIEAVRRSNSARLRAYCA